MAPFSQDYGNTQLFPIYTKPFVPTTCHIGESIVAMCVLGKQHGMSAGFFCFTCDFIVFRVDDEGVYLELSSVLIGKQA